MSGPLAAARSAMPREGRSRVRLDRQALISADKARPSRQCIAEGAAGRYKSLPMLIMHGAKDSISGTVRLQLPRGWPALAPHRLLRR